MSTILTGQYDEAALTQLLRAQYGGGHFDTSEVTNGGVTAKTYTFPSAVPLALEKDGTPTGYAATLLQIKGPELVATASAACDSITAQIVPDATHQTAYTNAATIVWANGGNAPASEPAKSVFAAQGASVGITDPAVFAKVVVGVSLASMELATILGVLKGEAAQAKTTADLMAALTAFEQGLNAFVAGLNSSGLTATITAPAAIVISGINA